MNRAEVDARIKLAKVKLQNLEHQRELLNLMDEVNMSLSLVILNDAGSIVRYVNAGTFGDPEFEHNLRELAREWIIKSMKEDLG